MRPIRMVMLTAIIYFSGPPAMILWLCSLLGIWLAFGRTHVLIRMPAFLLSTLPIGLGLCIAEATSGAPATLSSPPWDGWLLLCITKSASNALIYYAFGVLLLAVSLVRTHVFIKMLAFAFGTLMLASVFFGHDWGNLDSEWIVRVTLATTFVAGMIGTIRWFGFRLVNLTEGVPNVDIEKGTGRDLDEWIGILNTAHGESLNHAEIMAFLRRYSFSFDWQRTITVAYEKALGRRAVGQTAIGKSQVVVPETHSNLIALLNRPTHQQFTIWQLMLLTFTAASLLGFVRTFTWYVPTFEDLKYGAPLAVGVATISQLAICGCLTIRNGRSRMLIASFVAAAIAGGVSFAMGNLSINPMLQILLFPILLAYAGLVVASLILVRHRGYRLVRVQLR